MWVVQVEASEELGEVLVRAVPIRRDFPRGGKQEVFHTILSREILDQSLKLLLIGVAGVWGIQDWRFPLLHFGICPFKSEVDLHSTFAVNCHRLSDRIVPAQGGEGTRKHQGLRPRTPSHPPFCPDTQHETAAALQPKEARGTNTNSKKKNSSKGTWERQGREQLRTQHSLELLLAQVLQGYVAGREDDRSGSFNPKNNKVLGAVEIISAGSCLCENFP